MRVEYELEWVLIIFSSWHVLLIFEQIELVFLIWVRAPAASFLCLSHLLKGQRTVG